jgi:hypothetical protein
MAGEVITALRVSARRVCDLVGCDRGTFYVPPSSLRSLTGLDPLIPYQLSVREARRVKYLERLLPPCSRKALPRLVGNRYRYALTGLLSRSFRGTSAFSGINSGDYLGDKPSGLFDFVRGSIVKPSWGCNLSEIFSETTFTSGPFWI